jgi:hypothetical protein
MERLEREPRETVDADFILLAAWTEMIATIASER